MTVEKAFSFKVELDHHRSHAELLYFTDVIHDASQQLLAHLWTEAWIETLATITEKKAYKVIDEAQVAFPTTSGAAMYLPSRIRRGIAERVGQILRAQHTRKACFYECLQIVAVTGLTGNLNRLVWTVAKSLQVFHGRYYRYTLIRQTLRLLRRLQLKYGLDVWMLRYTDVVRPLIRNFIFPYSPDDGQAIHYCCDGHTLTYSLKLPMTTTSTTRHDWHWITGRIVIPERLQTRISQAADLRPQAPVLRQQRLKGGLRCYMLQFAWSFPAPPPAVSTPYVGDQRALCVDLGVTHLATSVVCEAGYQMSAPSFITLHSPRYRAIERCYTHLAGVQRKLKRYPRGWRGQGKRGKEQDRLNRKLRRVREELAHALSNELLQRAVDSGCNVIILEDLRSYEPPKGKRQLSRRLSNWLRGRVPQLLAYKCALVGLRLLRVNPWGTSSYCPRCGTKGRKVRAPNHLVEEETGHYFHCGQCGFIADRDYVAALNIYRAARLNPAKGKNTKTTLHTASPVLYRRTGTPLNRPSGGTVASKPHQCLLVTGRCWY